MPTVISTRGLGRPKILEIDFFVSEYSRTITKQKYHCWKLFFKMVFV